MLSFVFGFLDNYGLFYGLDGLNSMFYWFSARVMSGVVGCVHYTPSEKQSDNVEKLLVVHRAVNDVMNGLGNTFSDLVGVLVGTAALEIAKTGLNIEPSFWPGDIISIVVGCLLGAFLPALQKHAYSLTGNHFLQTLAMLAQLLILLSIIMIGFPVCFEAGHERVATFAISMSCVALVFLFLFILLVLGIPGAGVWNKLRQPWHH